MFVIPNSLDEPFTRLMIAQPQLAAFLLDSGVYVLVDDRDNPTACTDGRRWIRINPKFFAECNNGEQGVKGSDIFALAHEILHVMLMHDIWMKHAKEHGILLNSALVKDIQKFNPDTKWKAGDSIPAIPTLVQWALDYVINALLHAWGMKLKPYGVLWDLSIALPTDSEYTAYCRLIGKFKVEPNELDANDPALASSTGKPGDGGTDMVEGYPGDLPAGAEENAPDPIRRKMAVAKALTDLENAAKARGEGGLGIGRLIERLMPSPIRWRQHVTRELKAASGRGQSTWNRLSSRGLAMKVALPGRISRQSGVVVVQRDTSGSQGQMELEQMGGCSMEVLKQIQPRRLILLDTDYDVQQVREPKSPQELYRMLIDLGFKGGGGTRMEAGFEWCKQNKIVPDTLITLTDGYTSWPTDYTPAKHALWVITTPGIEAPKAAGASVYMPLDRNC